MGDPAGRCVIAADDKHLLVHNNFMLQREKFRHSLRDQLILLGANPEWHLEDGEVPETGEFIAAAIIDNKLSIEYDTDVLAQASCIAIGQYTEFANESGDSTFFVWRWEPHCREKCSQSSTFTLPELTVKEFVRGSVSAMVQIIAAIQYEMQSEYIYEHMSEHNVVAGTTEVYALRDTNWAPGICDEVSLDAKNDE